MLAVGQRIFDLKVIECSKEEEYKPTSLYQLFAKRYVLLIGVPGAFTPVCTKDHLAGFVEAGERLKRIADMTYCLSINDVFSMQAWARLLKTNDKYLHMLSSPECLPILRKYGLTEDLSKSSLASLELGERPKRFVMLLSDLVIQHLEVEESVLVCKNTSAKYLGQVLS